MTQKRYFSLSCCITYTRVLPDSPFRRGCADSDVDWDLRNTTVDSFFPLWCNHGHGSRCSKCIHLSSLSVACTVRDVTSYQGGLDKLNEPSRSSSQRVLPPVLVVHLVGWLGEMFSFQLF